MVANAIVLLVTALPFYLGSCAQAAGQDCSPLRPLLPHVFTVAGVLVSPVALRLVAAGPPGRNPLLSAAGAIVVFQTLVFVAYRLVSLPMTGPWSSLAIGLGLAGSTMLAAGAVLRRRALGRKSLNAFALIVILFWVGTQWPILSDIIRGTYVVQSPVALFGVLVGPVELAALLLGWMLLLPGAGDGSGLVEVNGGVERDEEDPAARG